jgi:hypothetical protein
MSRRRSTEATGITHATTPAPRRPQAGAAGVAAPVAPQASPNPSRESSSAAREGTPDRRAPSSGLRAYGRTWLPSAAGDVVPVTIARWTRGAARDGWCSPRGATPDMVAVMHFTGFGRVALDLARDRASDLRRAARDPRCESGARRAINRHLRTRRPSPTPRDADAMLREMVPLAPVLDRSPRPVRARSLARVVRAVEALPPPLPGRLRVCDADGWRATLRAAMAIAPELPRRTFMLALASSWGTTADVARNLARSPCGLARLAAAVASFGRGEESLSPSARRRAVALRAESALPIPRTTPRPRLAAGGR